MRVSAISTMVGGFVLLASAGGEAATYYVRNSGNDAADGASHATAWATIEQINDYDFAAGDSVLLHQGHHWEGQLIVDWSGTDELPVVIGSYFMKDGVQTRGFETSRPTIDGADRLPTQGAYDALIRVSGDRVRLENLHVTRSEGRGISFADVDHGQVVDCVTDGTYKSGINFLRSDYGKVLRNFVSHAGLAYPEDGGTWSGAIEFVDSDSGRVSGNTVAEVFGEGINANHGATGTVIEGNRVYAARAVGIYADAAPNTIIRRNIVVGTSDSTYWRASGAVGAGIALNNETYHYAGNNALDPGIQSRNVEVYGNLVAFTGAGVSLWSALAETSHDNVLIINNTLVDNNVQINGLATASPGGKIANNVLASISPGTRDVSTAALTGAVAKNNFFSGGDPGGDLAHAGNRYDGLALTKYTGWRIVNGYDEINWQDFGLVVGSAAIGAGDNEPLQLSVGSNDYHLDFNRLEFSSPMDMGALRFTEFSIKTPKRPSEVLATP